MGQINLELLSKLSAPHLKEMKMSKQELIDLYQQLHKEYQETKPPEATLDEEESSGKVLNSIDVLKASVDAASQLLTEAQRVRDETQRRNRSTPQLVGQRQIVRDEQGRIKEVLETAV